MISLRPISAMTLSFLFCATFSAHADQAPCVKAYRAANTQFFEKIEKLESARDNAKYAVPASAAVGGACFWGFRSVTACSFVAGVGAVFAGGQWWTKEDHIEYLDNARRMYQIYFVSKYGGIESSVEYSEMLSSLELNEEKSESTERAETVARAEFISQMEDGTLCEEGTPTADYEAVLESIKEKLEL